MKPNHSTYLTNALLVLLGSLFIANTASADAPGTLANEPLQTSASAPPNLMFMIDTSGSMNNVVPDAPYDPTTDYTPAGCGSTITQATDTSIIYYLHIIGGSPFIHEGSNDHALGTFCFDQTTNYLGKLNADDGTGNDKTTTGYFEGVYTGNYLNWYFSSTDNSDTWTIQSMKPAPSVDSRLNIAKTASTGLISGLSNMRVGLTRFNSGYGAYIEQNVKTLNTTHKTALTNSINGLSGSGSTPVAETLLGIGRYFVGHAGTDNPNGLPAGSTSETNGEYEGNLTLFPDAATPVLKDDDAVFNTTGAGGSNPNPKYASNLLSKESPIQHWCQQNFAILLTDGRPASDQGPGDTDYTVAEVTDYDDDCTSCTDDRKTVGSTGPNGGIYDYTGTTGTDYMDDVAMLLYDIDLRPDIDDNNNNEVKNNIRTYTIGFADDQVLNDALIRDTAVNGGGEFLIAANAGDLVSAFNRATNSIIAQSSTSSAVTFNSSTLSSQSAVYQALFNTVRWSGELKSIPLDGFTGAVLTNCTAGTNNCWSAEAQLDAQIDNGGAGTGHTSRLVLTNNNGNGVAFKKPSDYQNLTATDVPQALINDLCGAGIPHICSTTDATEITANQAYIDNLIDYLRGDRIHEDSSSTYNFRTRTHVLGDLVNASPIYVGEPASNWPDTAPFPIPTDPAGQTGDDSYTNWSNGVSRSSIVYASANDGMLHGFRTMESTSGAGDAGNEVFAYVPTGTFSATNNEGLHYLADPAYTHRYYNDLTPTIADVYVNHKLANGTVTGTTSSTRVWRTMLLGGQRGGGRSLYLLDVTDPDNDFEEADAKQLVEWEFTHDDLGYAFSKPTMAMMNDGRFAAIFGNGYNSGRDGGSGDCRAKLFIVFLEGGQDGTWTTTAGTTSGTWSATSDYIVLDTGSGSTATDDCNGLSTPAVVDLDRNGTADRVYAGDLKGNLWAFDLCKWDASLDPDACASTTTDISWSLANASPIMTTDDDGSPSKAQPITVKPIVSRDPADGAAGDDLLVVFGTGQYLTEADKSNTQVQTMYGVLDESALSNGRSRWGMDPRTNPTSFTVQTIQELDCPVNTCTGEYRIVSDNARGNDEGWLIDFPPTNTPAVAAANAGERIVTDPKIRNNTVFFNTVIPDSTVCNAGGTGWLMSVNLENGGQPLTEIFDTNNNGVIDVNDQINSIRPVGEKIQAIPAESTFLGDKQYTPDSTGTINVRDVNIGKTQREGRLSWREMIVD